MSDPFICLFLTLSLHVPLNINARTRTRDLCHHRGYIRTTPALNIQQLNCFDSTMESNMLRAFTLTHAWASTMRDRYGVTFQGRVGSNPTV